MAFPGRFELQGARRPLAAALSAAVHLGLFLLIALAGGRHDGIQSGDTSLTRLTLIEAPTADHREGVDLTPIEPTVVIEAEKPEQLLVEIEPAASPPADAVSDEIVDTQAAPAENSPAATVVMSEAETSALSQRLARLAEQLAHEPRTRVNWEQDGKQYSAVLIQERANDGTALDRVVAEVSAADRGRQLATHIVIQRLAFSQFTQMVDHWDPMVQLHNDVIVGRFHSNSRFNVMHDSQSSPTFLGKVTTAARGFDLQSSGRTRQSSIFRAGFETRTDRISLPEGLQPSKWAPEDTNARVHDLIDDTHIRFFADGSYNWRTQGSDKTGYLNAPSEHPVYFIATPGTTLYVQGVVAGSILVYSPQRIVVEGNLTYAHDPRAAPDSPDYLGLVCDRYVEIAPPEVTGSGDLKIDAAILAGRRFVVRDFERGRPATLRIYGSLSAGSLSASEPRYATKIEYDGRFEHRRPPGFPSTDRYEVADWDGQWVERERTADEVF